MKSFAEFGISIPSNASGEIRTTCPECSKDRRKSRDRCLAVNVDQGVWYCHHCFISGSLALDKTSEQIKTYFRPPQVHIDLPVEMLEYLKKRGLSDITISKHGICLGDIYIQEEKRKVAAFKFPYFKGGVVVNAKYRSLDKRFRQEVNAEACLYRFDSISQLQPETLIICEGELDALACYEAGFPNVTSVPNGAPAPNAKHYQKEFSYLESSASIFENAKKIILAVDNDAPGKVLEQELARRIGVEKCYRVQFPTGCKDANDVLVKQGPFKLQEVIEEAKPYPVTGIFSSGDLSDLVFHLYDQGEQSGKTTGWPVFDQFYTVKEGQVTVITGIPGHGKSAFVGALSVNLARNYGWSFAIFSPENWPLQRHIQSLAETICGKTFDKGGPTERISRDELQESLDFMSERFFFLMPEEELMTIDTVLEKARVTIFRHGVRGVIIDPYNELDHDFQGLSETQYISSMLGKIRRFARRNDVHVWIVAHPQKLFKDKDTGKYKPPTMYEISGGAHWRNKADVGLCIHRPDMNVDEAVVYVQKVRFREVGKLGAVCFKYSRTTGRYFDKDAPEDGKDTVADSVGQAVEGCPF
jgi:twinkle protein